MSAITKIITPGSAEDRLAIGRTCEHLARVIIGADPNHTRHRIDLYREVMIDGRGYFVRVKFTVPFLAVAPPGAGDKSPGT